MRPDSDRKARFHQVLLPWLVPTSCVVFVMAVWLNQGQKASVIHSQWENLPVDPGHTTKKIIIIIIIIIIIFNFDLKMLRLDDDLMLPGRSFHILGPATEKARDFITDEVVKGTQSNCLSLERRLRDST